MILAKNISFLSTAICKMYNVHQIIIIILNSILKKTINTDFHSKLQYFYCIYTCFKIVFIRLYKNLIIKNLFKFGFFNILHQKRLKLF